MTNPVPKARTMQVKTLVTEQVHTDLFQCADALGLTASAAAAYAIGAWVAQQKRSVALGDATVEALGQSMGTELRAFMEKMVVNP